MQLYSEFEMSKQAMLSETTTTVEALKLQATIGLLESMIRHVRIFAKGNKKFTHVKELLDKDFAQKLKEFRLAYLKRRLELDDQSFFGLLRFINEDSVYCEDQ